MATVLGTPQWEVWNLEDLLPQDIVDAIKDSEDVVELLAQGLDLVATTADILVLIVGLFIDPLFAFVELVRLAIESAWNDFKNTGLFWTIHIPTKPSDVVRIGGQQGWIEEVHLSVYDSLDEERPQFSEFATVSGIVLLVGVPELSALKTLLELLDALFDLDWLKKALERFPFPEEEDFLSTAGQGQVPRWKSKLLFETFGFMRAIDKVVNRILDLITIAGDLRDLYKIFAEFIRQKAVLLREIAEVILEIEALLIALLTGSGPSIIAVTVTSGGLDAFFDTIKVAEGFPGVGQDVIGGAVLLAAGPSTVFFNLIAGSTTIYEVTGEEISFKNLEAQANGLLKEPNAEIAAMKVSFGEIGEEEEE